MCSANLHDGHEQQRSAGSACVCDSKAGCEEQRTQGHNQRVFPEGPLFAHLVNMPRRLQLWPAIVWGARVNAPMHTISASAIAPAHIPSIITRTCLVRMPARPHACVFSLLLTACREQQRRRPWEPTTTSPARRLSANAVPASRARSHRAFTRRSRRVVCPCVPGADGIWKWWESEPLACALDCRSGSRSLGDRPVGICVWWLQVPTTKGEIGDSNFTQSLPSHALIAGHLVCCRRPPPPPPRRRHRRRRHAHHRRLRRHAHHRCLRHTPSPPPSPP